MLTTLSLPQVHVGVKEDYVLHVLVAEPSTLCSDGVAGGGEQTLGRRRSRVDSKVLPRQRCQSRERRFLPLPPLQWPDHTGD